MNSHHLCFKEVIYKPNIILVVANNLKHILQLTLVQQCVLLNLAFANNSFRPREEKNGFQAEKREHAKQSYGGVSGMWCIPRKKEACVGKTSNARDGRDEEMLEIRLERWIQTKVQKFLKLSFAACVTWGKLDELQFSY